MSSAAKFIPDDQGWSGEQHGVQLARALDALASSDVFEPVHGLALFIRSRLPYARTRVKWQERRSNEQELAYFQTEFSPSYEADRAEEAAQELMELMYGGRSRAFLASLCGNVPFHYIQDKAAALCAEMLTAPAPHPLEAGALRAWRRALLDMPRTIWQPYVEALFANRQENADITLTYEMVERGVAPSTEVMASLEKLTEALVGHPEPQWATATLLSIGSPGYEHARGIRSRAGFVQYLSTSPDDLSPGQYMSAALILDGSDGAAREAAAKTILSSPARGADHSAAAARALLFTQSPLLKDLLIAVCDDSGPDELRSVALALGPGFGNKEKAAWLEGVLESALDLETIADLLLGTALGWKPAVDIAQEIALSDDDLDLSVWFEAALTVGGNPEAMVGVAGLARASRMGLRQARQGGGQGEKEWSLLLRDATSALSVWARQTKGVSPLRWRLLSDLLLSEIEDGLDDRRCMVILLGMARLSRSAAPSDGPYRPTGQGAEWLDRMPASNPKAEPSPRLCSGEDGGSLWESSRLIDAVWNYCSQRDLEATSAGVAFPLDPDQEQARQQASSGDELRTSREPPSRNNRFHWTLIPLDRSIPEDKEVSGWIRKAGIEKD